jgi:Asp-tRNA(Asn)/Glu-tRNA(Gln) amidotransferase A subunit family amidase
MGLKSMDKIIYSSAEALAQAIRKKEISSEEVVEAYLQRIEEVNLVYGRTLNSCDLSRTPGGSSGGESAIIAAGGSPLGPGNDMGGSIRLPSHFCGIAGIKLTAG